MAIYTFSTKQKKPEDDETVKKVKEYCSERSLNFSGLVVSLLRKYKKENIDD